MLKNETDFNYTARVGIWFILILLVLVFLGSCKEVEPTIKQEVQIKEVEAQEPTPTLSEKEQIIQEINQVFGVDADKAMRVLTDPKCHENLTLNPSAVNYNWTKEPNVWWSRDIGVFQVNDYYHGHKGDLWDWKDNIRVAKSIFNSSGWSAWVCGRYLNLK